VAETKRKFGKLFRRSPCHTLQNIEAVTHDGLADALFSQRKKHVNGAGEAEDLIWEFASDCLCEHCAMLEKVGVKIIQFYEFLLPVNVLGWGCASRRARFRVQSNPPGRAARSFLGCAQLCIFSRGRVFLRRPHRGSRTCLQPADALTPQLIPPFLVQKSNAPAANNAGKHNDIQSVRPWNNNPTSIRYQDIPSPHAT
jgi:hypothetical protein